MQSNNGEKTEMVFGKPIPHALIRCIIPTTKGFQVHLMDGHIMEAPGAMFALLGAERKPDLLVPDKRIIT